MEQITPRWLEKNFPSRKSLFLPTDLAVYSPHISEKIIASINLLAPQDFRLARSSARKNRHSGCNAYRPTAGGQREACPTTHGKTSHVNSGWPASASKSSSRQRGMLNFLLSLGSFAEKHGKLGRIGALILIGQVAKLAKE